MNPQAPDTRYRPHDDNQNRGGKPRRLRKGCRNRKSAFRRCLARNTFADGADHKTVTAGLQVRVNRLPRSATVDPVLVITFEPVTEPNLLRRGEAERGEIDLDPSGVSLESLAARERDLLIVGD